MAYAYLSLTERPVDAGSFRVEFDADQRLDLLSPRRLFENGFIRLVLHREQKFRRIGTALTMPIRVRVRTAANYLLAEMPRSRISVSTP